MALWEETTPGQSADNLLALFDAAPLNRRYWVSFVLLSALFVLEFFDFLIVGYLLAVLAPQWHLTYGQSAVILYSGGVGAILGALVFGGLSDAWGRKITMIVGTFICAASSGLMGIVPSGSWEIFAVLRFFIGVGLTAGVTPSLAIQVRWSMVVVSPGLLIQIIRPFFYCAVCSVVIEAEED